jgi:hypothetical protein
VIESGSRMCNHDGGNNNFTDMGNTNSMGECLVAFVR